MAKLFRSCETMKLVCLSVSSALFFIVVVRAVDFNEQSPFVYRHPKEVARTEAGVIKSLRITNEAHESFNRDSIDLNFITMEPKSLLLPLFLNRDYVLYVHTGEARVGWVWKNHLVERDLRVGDIYRIPAGCVFYVSNTGEVERLRLFGIMERDKAGAHFMQGDDSQMIFVGGGYSNPTSVLSGFDQKILRSAFKVSVVEIKDLLGRQHSGPIVQSTNPGYKNLIEDWGKRYIVSTENAFRTMLGWNKKKMEAFNILNKKPSFHNKYGWTKVVDKKDYPPLIQPDLSIFRVNLSKGTMLSPHWNPRATEIAIVTKGRGMVQIVYPNGGSTERIRVSQGDVFVVPQFYPMSQLSFGNESFEFVGFSTCSRGNQPQFLAGANSVLNILNKDSLALGFGVSSDYLTKFSAAQRDAVIFTCPSCAEELEDRDDKRGREEKGRGSETEEGGEAGRGSETEEGGGAGRGEEEEGEGTRGGGRGEEEEGEGTRGGGRREQEEVRGGKRDEEEGGGKDEKRKGEREKKNRGGRGGEKERGGRGGKERRGRRRKWREKKSRCTRYAHNFV